MAKFDIKNAAAKSTKEFSLKKHVKETKETKPNENSIKKEKERSNGNSVAKETLNEFKKKPKQFKTKGQPVVPHSAFHHYCARVRKMTPKGRHEQFGDIDSLSKLDQVKKISSHWKTTKSELKQECLEEFKAEMEKYKAKKLIYEQNMDEFQLNGDSNTIYVGNLSSSTTKENIMKVCEPFGDIVEVRLVSFKGKKPINPFGFVEFANTNEAKKALQLDQKDLDGQIINVKLSAARKDTAVLSKDEITLKNASDDKKVNQKEPNKNGVAKKQVKQKKN